MKNRLLFLGALLISSLSLFATTEIVQIGDLYYNLYSESQTAELLPRQGGGVYTGTYVDTNASYTYAMEAHDEDNQLINTDKGSFGAEMPTGIYQITNDQLPMTNKLIRDGQLIILREGKQYNALGSEIK